MDPWISQLKPKSMYYDADGNMIFYTEYEYNSDGNEIKSFSYTPDGQMGSYSECEYDEEGSLLKTSIYRADGTLQDSWSQNRAD